MKNRIISIIITIVMVLSFLPAIPTYAEYSGTCGENVIWTFDELTGILTISGEGDMYDYKYPYNNAPWSSYSVVEAVIEKGVISIGDCAFYNETTLVKVTIPEEVAYIGKSAFYTTSLTNLIIPDGVKSIEQTAFKFCNSLTDVTISDSVVYIGAEAFAYSKNLSSVKMGKGVKNIGYGAFQECPINGIDLPPSLVIIGESAFYKTRITNFNIPEGVRYIGARAFDSDDDYELQSLNLPDGIINVGTYLNNDYYDKYTSSSSTFYEGEYLLNAVARTAEALNLVVKDGTKVIADNAFSSLSGRYFESVYIPASVEYIGNWAFENASIEKLTIEGDLKEIGYQAFYNSNIKELNIKGDVEHINDYAFACCRIENFNVEGKIKIIGDYAFSEISGLTSIEFPEGLEIMGNGVFYKSAGIESITLPETLDHIKEDTFYCCYKLKNINIPESVKEIGYQAFCGCKALTDIVIGENVEKIGHLAFKNSALENITMADAPIRIGEEVFTDTPYYDNEANWENGVFYVGNHIIKAREDVSECNIKEGTVTIGRYAFLDNDNITSVNIPQSVQVIEEQAFYHCSNMTEIVLPEGLKYIGSNAFADTEFYYDYENWEDSGLYIGNYLIEATSNEIKPGTTLIASGALTGCYAYEMIIPDSVKYIGERAFDSNMTLYKVQLPEGLEAIEEGTFVSCTALEEIVIPEGVERIGDSAFENCTNLKEITVPKTVTAMGELIFNGCTSLEKAHIYANVTGLSNFTFAGCKKLREIEISNSIVYFDEPFSGSFATISYAEGEVDFSNIFFSGDGIGFLSTVVWTTASDKEPESVSIEGNKEVKKDGKSKFTATVLPKDAKDKSIKWSSSNESVAKVDQDGNVTGVSLGYAVITAETVNGLIAARLVEVLDKACRVVVKGYDLDDMTGSFTDYEYEILPYATVTIGNVTKTTDENGEVIFEQDELPEEPYADVKIYYNDEYETKESTLYFIDSGEDIEVYTFLLRELDDNIAFQSINAFIKNRKHNLLKQVGKTYISYFDDEGNVNEEAISVNVTVEWGKHKENTYDRKIWLEGTVEGKTVPMIEGANIVKLTDYFDIEEPIKLVATTKNKDGNEVRCEKILPVELRIVNVKLEVPDTEDIPAEDLYLLENLSTKISLGDISKAAGEIAYEKGTIILEFGGKDGENKKVSLFDGFLVGKAGPEVSVTGRVQIPINKAANGKWSGGVKVNMGRKASAGTLGKKETVELFGTTYNFTVSGLPCYIDSNLEAGIEGELELSGDYEKALFTGKMESEGSFAVSGGLGAGYDTAKDDIELKVGVEGKLDVKLPATYTYTGDEQKVEFDPEIKGSVNGKIEAKILVIDVEGRLEFGSVTWTKNGAVWKVFGEELNEANLMELTEEDWQIVGRSYLENGGGFMTQSELFEETEKDFTVLYENVIPVSDMSMTLVDDVPYIFFVSDLQSRDDANNATLMYTSYFDGEWSYPEAVYDDATVDTDVDADGNFIVWENSEREFTMNDTLEDILKATNISVAVMDSDAFCIKEFGEDGVYDFGAKVKMCDGGAYVTWLSNSEGDFTTKNGTTNINYSIYDGEWSEVGVIEDVGEVTNLNVLDGKIIYKKGTEIYSFSMSEDTEELLAADAGRYAIEEAQGKVILSYLDGEKILNIFENGVETTKIATGFSGSENPTLAMSEGKAYVFWREADGIYFTTNASGEWSRKLLFANVEGYVSNITVVATEEGYRVSYYVTEGGVTDLVTYTCEDGFDYTMMGAEYDYDMYTSEGNIYYRAEIRNNGELTGKDVEIHILEDGDLVYKAFVDEVILPGEAYSFEDTYSPSDWRIGHEYEIEVVCPLDRNNGNNSVLLSVGEVDVAVEDAYLEKDDFGNVHLYARVANNGNIIAENLTVKVYEDDLKEEIVRGELTLEAGDMRLVEFALSPQRDAVYNISIEAEDDVNMYNNTMLIYYDAIETAGISIPFTDSTSEKAVLIIAVYSSEGVLKSVKRETIEMSNMGSMTLERVVGDIEAGDKVKVMAWDGVNMLVPVTSATMTN